MPGTTSIVVMHRPTRPTTVGELAGAVRGLVTEVRGDPETKVCGLAYDSRSVKERDLFFCIVGHLSDGHIHAPEAVAAGAGALCSERPLALPAAQIVVSDARRAMALMAAEFFGRPADDLLLLGVTGTNGKTTTAYLLDSILRASGHTTGLVGTVETRIAGTSKPGVRTTPESLDLQQLFAEMRDAGVTAGAMEVTSHALVLSRVEGVRFSAAGFTNLSQDHLDFHKDMEDYFAAKRALFTPERAERGAVNADDPYGRRLLTESRIPCASFGMGPDAAVRAEEVSLQVRATEFTLVWPGGAERIRSRLVGRFNVLNCLAAATVALEAGIGIHAIARGLGSAEPVPGRFESIDAGQPFTVVCDYAHTPDSLNNVLASARGLAAGNGGRVLCVFGAGGDRDRRKRPLMGSAAARHADVVILTSDNPRNEDPMAIISEVLEGVVAERTQGADAVLEDRGAAIRAALEEARPGDVVVIAGKGHETGQEIAGRKLPFDDREVARGVLADLGWRRPVPSGA